MNFLEALILNLGKQALQKLVQKIDDTQLAISFIIDELEQAKKDLQSEVKK